MPSGGHGVTRQQHGINRMDTGHRRKQQAGRRQKTANRMAGGQREYTMPNREAGRQVLMHVERTTARWHRCGIIVLQAASCGDPRPEVQWCRVHQCN